LVNNEAGGGKAASSDLCIQLLSHLYFESTPKNPLKSAIARMLMTFPEESHDTVCAHLSASLNKLITAHTTPIQANTVMVAINCCFDNFSLGVSAVSCHVALVLEFIKTSLKSYLLQLSEDVSPAKKMEICQMVHNAVRTTVSLLQKCQTEVRQVVSAETGHKDELDSIMNLADLITIQCRITDSSQMMW
ncbi:hypothetical protein L9F63_016802, partial [Diploptera punctata]